MPKVLRILLAVALLALAQDAGAKKKKPQSDSVGDLAATVDEFSRAMADQMEGLALGLAQDPQSLAQAGDIFEKVVEMRHPLGDVAAELATLDRLADARVGAAQALCQAGEFQPAVDQATKGLAQAAARDALLAGGRLAAADRAAAEVEARWDEGQAQLVLGHAHAGLREFDPARTAYARALELFWRPQWRGPKAEALEGAGLVALAAGHAAEAIRSYEYRLFLVRELGDRHGEIGTLDDLARAQLAGGRGAEAVGSLAAAIRLVRELRESGQAAPEGSSYDATELKLLLRQVDTLGGLAGWEDARTYGAAALTLAQATGDAASELTARLRLAQAAANLVLWDEAAEQYGASMERVLAHRDAEAASALRNAGVVFIAKGELDVARQAFDLAVEIAREIGSRVQEQDALDSVGLTELRREQPAAAVEPLERAVALARELSDVRAETASLERL
ncbi:MAG TPA: tetratricopeptide repeat protein, partial [Candidatus Polarisedimenticolaceae bacterium]|nr:tetratricopeptide repeat protein [Candidatus Polarisedimenticolaceae bacterium]